VVDSRVVSALRVGLKVVLVALLLVTFFAGYIIFTSELEFRVTITELAKY
jgi:hypothetical protein